MFLALVQAAGASTLLGGHATEIALGALIAINGWQLKATLAFRDESKRLSQWAFGPEGENGINSDVKDLKEWRSDVDKLALPRRISVIERRHGPDDRREEA